MIPTFIFQTWLLGLFSLALIGGAAYSAHEWQQRSWGWDPVLQQSVFAPHVGWNTQTCFLLLALSLALIVVAGGPIVRTVLKLTSRKKEDKDEEAGASQAPTSKQCLKRPDGSELHVEFYGPVDGIPIVLTHGWGFDNGEWNYLKGALSERFRIIVWDEPGLGQSTRPANRDYSLENLAADLDAVLALAEGRPAILLGHSIGGMIILTFCRLFRASLGNRVMGLVLTHTTPTNPVRTTSGAAFFTAIEKPVLAPLMYLTIALSPLVRMLNWLSYFNGSAHLSTKRSSFAGTETWEQVEFATRYNLKSSPSVLARGMLGMMRYDATKTLPTIPVPTLVVAGDKDTTTKPEASERMRAGIPGARLLTLSPAKHLGLLEHHGKYAEAVCEFVHAARAQAAQAAA